MADGVATVETVARLINRALAKGDAEGAGPGAGKAPEAFQDLLYMQRRFVR